MAQDEKKGDAQPRFMPRPEARRMRWDELRDPEREAVHQLLFRLRTGFDRVGGHHGHGGASGEPHAGRPSAADESRFSHSFLISGARGSGKTTLLLSAAYACQAVDEFIPESNGQATKDERREQLRQDAERLHKRLIWLPVLDMELFPSSANLLATVLIRLRDALTDAPVEQSSSAYERFRRGAPPEFFVEEGAENALAAIDALSKDSTLMWEGIAERDPHKRIELQLDAAQTYACFQSEFRTAMDQIANELALPRFGRDDGQLAVVLPIDNVDRSAQHVFQIMKLIRMVYSPRLWYVLTATQEDLDVFLEGAYRRELGIGDAEARGDGESAGEAVVPLDARNRALELLLGIARRQAASTERAAVPPAHRVRIECLCPAEALEFRMEPEPNESLEDLLGKIDVSWPCGPPTKDGPSVAAKREGQAPDHPRTLRDLFVMGDKGGQPRSAALTRAGRSALTLAIRNLVDLSQAARFWGTPTRPQGASGGEQEKSKAAIGLVHEMLQNAIDDSELPDWACRHLKSRVLFRDGEGNICLDFRQNPLTWRPRFSVRNVLVLPPHRGHEARRRTTARATYSKIVLHEFNRYALQLNDAHHSARSIELPEPVGGWLMLLYDLLNQLDGPRIVIDADTKLDDENPMLVQTQHQVLLGTASEGRELVELRLSWPLPVYDCFLDFDRFVWRWNSFLESSFKDAGADYEANEENLRLLLLGWIDTTCSVSGQMAASDLKALTEEVVGTKVCKLYRDWSRHCVDPSPRKIAVQRWLQQDLLRLLLPEYLPSFEPPLLSAKAAWGDGPQAQWLEQHQLLAWQRYAAVRAAIAQSPAYRQLQRGPAAESNGSLRHWLRTACRQWFELDEHAKWARPWSPEVVSASPPLPAARDGGRPPPRRRRQG